MPKAVGVYRAGNGTWYFKIRAPRDIDSGDAKQITRRGFRSAAEASQARADLAAQLLRDPPGVSKSDLTVSSLVMRYHDEEEAMNRLSERTLYDQRGYRRNYIDPTIGAHTAAEVTTTAVREWMIGLSRAGASTGTPLSPNTVRLARSLLRKAFVYGVATGVVHDNPVDAVKPPRMRKTIPAHWSPDEARQFLAFYEGDRLYPLWAFMLSSGVRVSELVWLRWPNIDREAGLARISDLPTVIGYELKRSDGKNNSAIRTIDLDVRLLEILELQARLQFLEQQNDGYLVTDFVFTKPGGDHYHPHTISKTLGRETERLGLPRLTAHGLRHTCATLMLAGGVQPKVAAERLGHADTRMFSNVYSHVTETMQREAADKLGQILFDSTETKPEDRQDHTDDAHR